MLAKPILLPKVDACGSARREKGDAVRSPDGVVRAESRAGDRDGRESRSVMGSRVAPSEPRIHESSAPHHFIFFPACSNPSETDAARCSSTLPTPFARSGSSFHHFEARHAVDARVRPARARPASSRDSRRRRCAPPPDPPFSREASASASASRARRFQLAPQMDARRPSPLTSSSPPLRSGLVLVLVPVPPAATCRVPWTSPTSSPACVAAWR